MEELGLFTLFYFSLFCLIKLKFSFLAYSPMGYCSVSDFRLLWGVSADVLGDAEVKVLIELGDQQIRDELGGFSEPGVFRVLDKLMSMLRSLQKDSRDDRVSLKLLRS